MWIRVFGLVTTLKLCSEKYFETTLGTSGSISAMVSFFDRRIDRDRAGGHAGAAADDQRVVRILRDQRRQVAEHPLQAHVLRFARRLHLAGVVIVEHAVATARDRHRGVPAFAHVDDLSLADAGRGVAAVGDEDRRERRCTVLRQEHGAGHRGGEQQRAGKLHAALLRVRFDERGVEDEQRRDRRRR